MSGIDQGKTEAADLQAPSRRVGRPARPSLADDETRSAAPSAPAETRAIDRPKESEEHDPTFDDVDVENLSRQSMVQGAGISFDVPAELMKPGWAYAFWPHSIVGQAEDPSILNRYHKQGWIPCKSPGLRKHFCPPNWKEDTIQVGGQMLYMRPVALQRQAANESREIADEQKRQKLKATLAGDAEGLHVPGTKRHVELETFEGEVGAYASDPIQRKARPAA